MNPENDNEVIESNDDIEEVTDIDESEDSSIEKTPGWFPVRLEFFTLIFIIFTLLAFVFLNVLRLDIYDVFIGTVRNPFTAYIDVIYNFIVPVPEGVEALYISACIIVIFLTFSGFCRFEKFRNALFQGKIAKRLSLQIGLFFLFLILYMHGMNYLTIGLNYVTLQLYGMLIGDAGITIFFLVAGASIWLLIQSYALFLESRRSATNVEGYFSGSKHRRMSYYGASIMPFIIAAYIIGLSVGYMIVINFMWVNLAVGYFPFEIIIEIVLFIMLTISLIPFFIIMRGKKEERRQKSYDNLVVLFTIFFMYPFILFNFTIFFYLNPAVIEQIKALVPGAGEGIGQAGQVLILIESIFIFVTLIFALRAIGKRTGYSLGGMDKYGFIFIIYAALVGQFGIRYLQIRGQLGESVPAVLGTINDVIINSQHLIMNSVLIIAIAVTIFLFQSKKFGTMFRVHEQVSKEDKKRMEFIYDFLMKEFVRRDENLDSFEMHDQLSSVLKLDEYDTLRLVNKTDKKYKELVIEGLKKRFIYFTEIKSDFKN